MPRFVQRAISAAVLVVLPLASACVAHDPEPAFRASVFIGDRGISIPLPPPSLLDEPKQDVEIEGEVVGLDVDAEGLVVRLFDEANGVDLDIPLPAGTSEFRAEEVNIDLTDNCLELWLEDADGRQGERQFYQAVISEDGNEVSVLGECE